MCYFFNIFGDDFRGRSKMAKIVMLRVKLWRYEEDAEKSHFHSKTVELTDHFISCFCCWLMVKYLKSSQWKINYDFFKRRPKEPSHNSSWRAAGHRRVSQKYNVIWSPSQYPCLVLGLVYREQEKKVWALTFGNCRSSTNMANIKPWKSAWHNFTPTIVLKFLTNVKVSRGKQYYLEANILKMCFLLWIRQE